ncbi:MAG: endonuclease/exonuclease/phosphatase family protein [Alistipes sp.]|nr:endonuclease/exonuclease/phosphatase family protein [Alistipes sp.]
MKKFFRFVVVLAVALAAISCSKEQTNSIKVISYNVRCSGGDGENHWDKRKHASLNMINDEKPTIFGLQEANPDQMQYLVENLPQYGYIGVGREDGVASGEHMAIFYLKEEVELLDGGTFWLSETPDTPSKGWDAACKRTCTWTKLKMKKTGTEFAYLNTHLDHVGKEAQREGLALIVHRAEEIVPQGMTAFVTADFNALTTDPIFEPLKADMKDAREEAPVTDHRGTYNGWNAANTANPNCVIDHIFFRGAEAHTFKVLCDKNYGAPYISDHYPVVMEATF